MEACCRINYIIRNLGHTFPAGIRFFLFIKCDRPISAPGEESRKVYYVAIGLPESIEAGPWSVSSPIFPLPKDYELN